MTVRFMKGTSIAELEREMQQVPGFRPRKSGIIRSRHAGETAGVGSCRYVNVWRAEKEQGMDGRLNTAVDEEMPPAKDSKKCSQKAVREDVIQAAFLTLWNRLASNYEEILIPMLAALKAIQGNPEQDREMQEIEQNIQELKRQGYRLGRVLTEGSISSAIFIERQNQIEAQLEADRRRLRQLQGQRAFEWEISQTEYLISVFRNRPAILEAYDEELFLLLVERITVLPGRRLVFRLKNGLELEENEQEVS